MAVRVNKVLFRGSLRSSTGSNVQMNSLKLKLRSFLEIAHF